MNCLRTVIHLVLLYLFLGVIVTALRPTPRSLIRQCLRHESQKFNKSLALVICCIISVIAVVLWPIIWITNIRAAAAAKTPLSNKEQLSLFGGGNGDSCETAVIVNAHNSLVGVEAEYAYIAKPMRGATQRVEIAVARTEGARRQSLRRLDHRFEQRRN